MARKKKKVNTNRSNFNIEFSSVFREARKYNDPKKGTEILFKYIIDKNLVNQTLGNIPKQNKPSDASGNRRMTSGCMDIYALNYCSTCTIDDESCEYLYGEGTTVGVTNAWDITGDGTLNVLDIVAIANCILNPECGNETTTGYYIPPQPQCEDGFYWDTTNHECVEALSEDVDCSTYCQDEYGSDSVTWTCLPNYFINPNADGVCDDLNCCSEVIENNGTVLCDDYNLSYAPGVKNAIDEYVKNKNYKCEILHNSRFAKIEKQ